MKPASRTAVALALFAASSCTQAGLQDEMDNLFGSMTNYTPPGYFETARRGVIGAGHYVQKNRIMSANLVSFVPPSLEAGCAGLDMNGGSFSFINADQFVQLLRSIASNAQGYAFQLALKAMSPSIAETMNGLQEKIQQFNQFFGDSCQMAQNLVDKSGAGQVIQENSAKLVAIFEGGADDGYDAYANNSAASALEKAESAAPDVVDETIKGNVVWRALKKSKAADWFDTGDDSLLEAIMSITGSIVVSDLADADDGAGKNYKTTPLPPKQGLTIDALIEGKEVEIYKCDNTDEDACLNPTVKTIDVVGFAELADDILLDPGTGLVVKFSTNTGTPTDQQTAFLAASPAGFGAMLRTLSAYSQVAARAFAKQAGPFISIGMAQQVMDDLVGAIRSSMASTDSAHAGRVLDMIEEAQNRLDNELLALQQRHNTSLKEMFETYEQIITKARKNRYWNAANAEPER